MIQNIELETVKQLKELNVRKDCPTIIKDVLNALCAFLEKPMDEEGRKKMLNTKGLMDKIQYYDKDNVSKKVLKNVKKVSDQEEFKTHYN